MNTHTEYPYHAQNNSGSLTGVTPAPTPDLPQIDEVCRILARILNRVQADEVLDVTVVSDAS